MVSVHPLFYGGRSFFSLSVCFVGEGAGEIRGGYAASDSEVEMMAFVSLMMSI